MVHLLKWVNRHWCGTSFMQISLVFHHFFFCFRIPYKMPYYIWSPNLPGGTSGKDSTCQCRRCTRCRFYPWVGKISWRMKWHPTPVFLSEKSHGQRSLAGYRIGSQRVEHDWSNLAHTEELKSGWWLKAKGNLLKSEVEPMKIRAGVQWVTRHKVTFVAFWRPPAFSSLLLLHTAFYFATCLI